MKVRIPRQRLGGTTLHATCLTPGCSRRGLELLPSLGSCPGCGRPLALSRQPRGQVNR